MNLRKVRVRMPKAQSGLEVKMKAGLGFNANQLSWPVMAGRFSEPELEERRTLGPTDWDNANLEAELGETAVTDLDGDGIPEHYNIGGKRHYDGGTPLNLPENSFIFSRDITMKIKDKDILAQFGITSAPKSGMTPADVAKKFNINQYKKVLLDKNTDELSRKTAEMMISNYNIMLGKLAMVQESMKGFPDGMPMIAMPYLESVGLKPEQFLPQQDKMLEDEVDVEDMEMETQDMEDTGEPEEPQGNMPTARYGLNKYQGNQDGSSTSEPLDWKVENVNGKPMFVGRSMSTGKVVKQQDNNPKSNDTRTAQDIYNSSNQSRGSTTRTVVPLSPSTIDDKNDYRLGENNQYFNQMRDILYNIRNKASDDRSKGIVSNETKAMDQIMANYKAELQKAKDGFWDPYKNKQISPKITQAEYDKLIQAGPDEVLNTFMNYQKQNYAFRNDKSANFGANAGYYDQPLWDQSNDLYKQTAKALGFTDDEILDDESIAMVQAAFRGLVNIQVADNALADKDKLLAGNGYRLMLGTGTVDQGLAAQDPQRYVSYSDKDLGNNSAQQLLLAQPLGNPPGKTPCYCDGKEVPRLASGACPPCDDSSIEVGETPEGITAPTKGPWWLQDVIQFTGDIMDYGRINKYLPWQATPAVDYLEPTFYSPERELAANAEQLAIGAGGLSNFASPQSYTANFSALAGKSSQNAADIMARYNALNVGVANEAEKYNTDVFNRYAENRAEDATTLFDKVVTANQQYDNSRNAARQKMRNSFISGITNAAQTQALNTLYPNYAVDAPTGGFRVFTGPGSSIAAIRNNETQSRQARLQAVMDANPGIDYNTAARIAGVYSSTSNDSGIPPGWGYPGRQTSQDDEEEEE